MANEYWIDNPVTTSYVNDGFQAFLMTDGNYDRLTKFMLEPGYISGLWTNIQDWMNGLLFFPVDINLENYGYVTPNYLLSFGAHQGQYYPTSEYGNPNVDVKIPLSTSRIYSLGSYYYEPYFNNYADYNGFTKVMVWLPYLGFVPLNTNDIIGKHIRFKLKINSFTGEGVYFISVSDFPADVSTASKVISTDFHDKTARIIATYKCQIGFSIPIGRSNSSELVRNTLLAGLNIASVASGLYAVPYLTSFSQSTRTKESDVYRRNPKTHRRYLFGKKEEEVTSQSESYSVPHSTGNECFDVFSDTLSLMHGNSTAGTISDVLTSLNGSQSIRIIIYRPRYVSVSSEYNHLYGKPNGTVKKLGQLWGYTEISAVHIEGSGLATITENERAMIERAITSGIILPETTFTINNVTFTAGGKSRWDEWIDNGGDDSTTFKDYNFTYDAGGVYCTISNIDYIIKKNDTPVQLDDYIESGEYQIVAATP